ncbi:MAG: hypothetical protein HUU16_14285 [Candidatus Omnitrophica bacterium]|nr:hypothetical protein [Candidatus Omnitrophota bacterium]
MEDCLVNIRLREGRKPKRYLLSGEFEASLGDWVAVQVDEDEDLGVVASRPVPLPEEWEEIELPSVLGKADPEEVKKAVQLRLEREPTAIKLAYEKVRERNLDIKLVSAFYFHRSNKMKFYFSSENRVDFRELVKDLAHIFHARIELRQIGVRDAAGLVGGYGLCGQELCCSRFLQGFEPITIKMAKDQHLALNPTKISGCCGRLLCCLKYEHQTYVDAAKHYPRLGAAGFHDGRSHKVVSCNIIKETIGLQHENQILEIPLERFREENPDWRNAPRFSLANAARPAPPVLAEANVEAALAGMEDPVDRNGAGGGESSESSSKRRRRRRRGSNERRDENPSAPTN